MIRSDSMPSRVTDTLTRLLTSAAAAVLLCSIAHATAPEVGVSGNRIIAKTAGTLGLKPVVANQTIDLRGVNFSGSEYTCTDGSGFWDVPAGNLTTIQHMRDDWHANFIRLELNEMCWLGINGVPAATGGANYQNAMAAFVNLATQNNMAVEVNLHFGDGGSANPTSDNYPGLDAAHAVTFWTSVANKFKSNKAVIFNLVNEPHATNEISWSCYLQGGCTVHGDFGSWTVVGTQTVVNAIRQTGATNPIVIAGLDWGNDLSQWLGYVPNDSVHAIIAGPHLYFDLSCKDGTCWNNVWQNIQASGYPVLVTELGQFGGCNHAKIDTFMNWADGTASPPVGYAAWAFTKASCGRGPALITNAGGSPTLTYGSGYQSHLRAVQ